MITLETIEETLEEWMGLSKQLKDVKAKEMDMRRDIVAFLVPTGLVGTHTRAFGIIDVKAVLKNNYKMDQEEVEKNLDSMTQAELNAVKMTASVIMSAYKLIPEDNRELLDMCIEVVPAAPTLSVDYKKDKSNE